MPKQSPVPNELTKPFWDACNEGRLVMQTCTTCDRIQYPPEPVCYQCHSKNNLEWRQMSGRGTIYGFGVMYDSRIRIMQAGQPFPVALVQLEEDPDILMCANLPGTPPDEVPLGAKVQVEFETTPTTGQKVPEWRVVG